LSARQFLECQAPRTNPNPPRRNAKSPYWKLSGDGSVPNTVPRGPTHSCS